jgi:hypothetical protein
MADQMENTIFYSKYCRHCLDFIRKLKSENLLDLFSRRICIDRQNNLPSFLKEVPTIIVDDYDEPISGDYAFKWIDFKNTKKAEKEVKESGIESFDIQGGAFDDFGVLDNGDNSTAYLGLGESSNLKKDGNSTVMYQESLLPQDMLSAANSTGGGGDIGKRLEKMENMRALDNNMMKR